MLPGGRGNSPATKCCPIGQLRQKFVAAEQPKWLENVRKTSFFANEKNCLAGENVRSIFCVTTG